MGLAGYNFVSIFKHLFSSLQRMPHEDLQRAAILTNNDLVLGAGPKTRPQPDEAWRARPAGQRAAQHQSFPVCEIPPGEHLPSFFLKTLHLRLECC